MAGRPGIRIAERGTTTYMTDENLRVRVYELNCFPDNDLGEDEGDEYSIAHRVLTRRRSVLDPNQSCCQDQLSSSIVLPQPHHKNQADIFINNLIERL